MLAANRLFAARDCLFTANFPPALAEASYTSTVAFPQCFPISSEVTSGAYASATRRRDRVQIVGSLAHAKNRNASSHMPASVHYEPPHLRPCRSRVASSQKILKHKSMTTPEVEPGLSRPRRDVLATRRCGQQSESAVPCECRRLGRPRGRKIQRRASSSNKFNSLWPLAPKVCRM